MMSTTSDYQKPASLEPSELGTQEYWNTLYDRELANHTTDEQDEGTVWFEENSAEETVMRLLDDLVHRGLLHKSGRSASRILDVGTGNGHMLFALKAGEEADEHDEDLKEVDEVWQGEMVGVDYSATSVSLAKQISTQRCLAGIDFAEWDLLQDSPGAWLGDGFDLILDKGTFDAISLMSQQADADHSCEIYCKRVTPLLKPGALLVVTSCNWTKAELCSWFIGALDVHLTYLDDARYPSFTFGGQTGQSIVTVVFQRSSTYSSSPSVMHAM